MISISVPKALTIAGVSFNGSQACEGELNQAAQIEIGPAQPGSLTTRTSNTVGTITMTNADHGIQTGDRIDIYWTGGRRRGVLVGTVSGLDVPFTVGAGTNLPSALDPVIVCVCGVEVFNLTGDDVQILAASVEQTANVKPNFIFVLADVADAELLYEYVLTNDSYQWSTGNGTNPIAGDVSVTAYVSHDDIVNTFTINVGALVA